MALRWPTVLHARPLMMDFDFISNYFLFNHHPSPACVAQGFRDYSAAMPHEMLRAAYACPARCPAFFVCLALHMPPAQVVDARQVSSFAGLVQWSQTWCCEASYTTGLQW